MRLKQEGPASKEKQQREMREIVLQYRYLDDIFMSIALHDKGTIKAVLDVIMGCDLEIRSVQAQDSAVNLYGHGVRFDVFASDAEGTQYDIEIQRAHAGADPKRARFNAAMIDSRALGRGEKYRDLPRTVIIFITEDDTLGDGLPIQHFHFTSDETGKQLQTGQEIIYVDSSCQEDTPLGSLMHDFHCRDARDIRNKQLAKRMEEIKTNETEVARMCEAVEKYGDVRHEEGRREGRREGRKEGRKEGREEMRTETIRSLMENGFSIERAFELLKVPTEEQKHLRVVLAEK